MGGVKGVFSFGEGAMRLSAADSASSCVTLSLSGEYGPQ
jgi:hypothetical protein